MNPYESGARKAIPAVLVYLKHSGRVLMLHRNTRPGDYHAGKWNGLGGKLEADEAPFEAALREVREEAGVALEVAQLRSLGVVQFPNFKAHKSEDWIAFVFVAQVREDQLAQVVAKSDEGELHWIPQTDVMALNLWAGDREFVPYVLGEKPFLATIWYQGEKVVRHSVTELRR